MRSLLFVLAVGVLMLGCSDGEDGGSSPATPEPPDSTFDWDSLPSAPEVTYAHGTPVMVAEATVDASGGSLEGPADTPLEGVVVTVPSGALAEPVTFTLGYDDGTFSNLGSDQQPGVVIVLESSGERVFSKPLVIEFPETPATATAIPYYIDEDGDLAVLPSLPADVGRGKFLTWHASDFTWLNQYSNLKPVFNGFHPSTDGFTFPNPAVRYVPTGRCWGMANFAQWYRKKVGSGFPSEFQDKVDTFFDGGGPRTAEDILATRAHNSVSWSSGLVLAEKKEEVIKFIETVKSSLSTGAYGVSIGMEGPNGAHVVLGIGYSDNQIAIYDPNYPGKVKAIDYTLDPLSVTYGKFSKFGTWGNGEQPLAETYERILDDARQGFHGENETKIEITSHQNGQKLSNPEISLEGNVYSGQVKITEIEMHVLYAGEAAERAPQTQPVPFNSDSFAFPLTLEKGIAAIWFKTRGHVEQRENEPIPNNTEEETFVLEYQKEQLPNSSFSMSSTATETTDQGHTETTVTISSNLSFETSAIADMVQQPGFDFGNCDEVENCDIVYAASSIQVPIVSGNNLPVSIEWSQDVYEKDLNGVEQLTQTKTASGAMDCQMAHLYIGIAPGSSAGNYRYRLVMHPGGMCINENQIMVTGQYKMGDDWYDLTPDEFHLSGPNVFSFDTQTEACQSPPELAPTEIEPWVKSQTGSQTWNFEASMDCDDGYTVRTEHGTATLTLVP